MGSNRGAPVLAADGYFYRDGEFLPLAGVNYWPGSCGVEMWTQWPEDEIARDLDLIKNLGLNCVRFFLRWQDFEPDEGIFDERQFARLARFLELCRERDVLAQPSLVVGWMSGGVFWPRWRAGRNIFADSVMLSRGEALAARAAETIAPFHDQLIGVDLGNELNCLTDSFEAPPEAVETWCGRISAAVRSRYPEALIVAGCEHGQVVRDSGWRFGAQTGTDYYSMHAYPVPGWHPLGFDGMADPLAQSLLPFYTRCARAFGPVLVQEFGTILTASAPRQEAYLRGILTGCWEAGCNGFLWWCLRDITARCHPYLTNGFEGPLGLVDASGKVKTGLEFFLDFMRGVRPIPPAPVLSPKTAGLYWPRRYYPRNSPDNPGNDPSVTGGRMASANFILRGLGYDVQIVRGDRPIPAGLGLLVVAGSIIGIDEASDIGNWVNAGGKLIWNGPDPVNWGPDYRRLIGASVIDYRATRTATLTFGDRTYAMASYPKGMRAEVQPSTAEVLAADDIGLPVLLRNGLGKGTVLAALPVVEDGFVATSSSPEARSVWLDWYRAAISALD